MPESSAFIHADKGWPEEKLLIQRSLGDRHAALNVALEKYVFRPRATYILSRQAWVFAMAPDERRGSFEIKTGYQTIGEAEIVMSLVRLAEFGDIGKIRLCEMCKKRWHVAAKRNYRFCSGQCREAFYVQSPDYHSRKAANQRRYRESLKRMQAMQAAAWNRLK